MSDLKLQKRKAARAPRKKINLDYRETFETEITPSTIAADFDDEITYLVPALVYFYSRSKRRSIPKKRRESEKLFVFTPLSSSSERGGDLRFFYRFEHASISVWFKSYSRAFFFVGRKQRRVLIHGEQR